MLEEEIIHRQMNEEPPGSDKLSDRNSEALDLSEKMTSKLRSECQEGAHARRKSTDVSEPDSSFSQCGETLPY